MCEQHRQGGAFSERLPMAHEIADDLQTALEQLPAIAENVNEQAADRDLWDFVENRSTHAGLL